MKSAVNDHIEVRNNATKEYSQLRVIEAFGYHSQFIIYGSCGLIRYGCPTGPMRRKGWLPSGTLTPPYVSCDQTVLPMGGRILVLLASRIRARESSSPPISLPRPPSPAYNPPNSADPDVIPG